MVTKSNTPVPPSGQEPLKKMPKVNPMNIASGNTGRNATKSMPVYREDDAAPKADPANKDRDAKFKLPEKVTPSEIKDQSFRYGGGRSAGNRSIADNTLRKVTEK